jgi:mRNA-degrading endonuclease RelE of RelBE toxin-antitoxin system
MFQLFFRPKARKILKALDRDIQLKINSALDGLILGGFSSRDIKKIQGTKNGYRLRIDRWRVLFILLTKEKRIEVVDIFMEKDKRDYHRRIQFLE